jgi:hypothetical protein
VMRPSRAPGRPAARAVPASRRSGDSSRRPAWRPPGQHAVSSTTAYPMQPLATESRPLLAE